MPGIVSARHCILALLSLMNRANSQESGIIGRIYEDGLPVVYRLVDEMPGQSARSVTPWLTVISWKYDGSSNNGMPEESLNRSMVRLEQAIEDSLLRPNFARHAYSRTGNGLKELVYYVSDRDVFMSEFNAALAGQPGYPIEINFYEDPKWEDFGKLIGEFRQGRQ